MLKKKFSPCYFLLAMTENVQGACIFLAGAMGSMIILTFGCMWKDKQIQTTGSLGGGKRQHLQRRLVKQRAVYLKLIVLDNHIQISQDPIYTSQQTNVDAKWKCIGIEMWLGQRDHIWATKILSYWIKWEHTRKYRCKHKGKISLFIIQINKSGYTSHFNTSSVKVLTHLICLLWINQT